MTYLSAVLKVEYSIQYTGVVKSTNTAQKKTESLQGPQFPGSAFIGHPLWNQIHGSSASRVPGTHCKFFSPRFVGLLGGFDPHLSLQWIGIQPERMRKHDKTTNQSRCELLNSLSPPTYGGWNHLSFTHSQHWNNDILAIVTKEL